MITERRTFQAKTGQAGAVVGKIRDAQPIIDKLGGPASRVYTDFYSGRTDRVVWELDHDNLGRLESFEADMAADAASLKFFEGWFGELQALIEGATVELWRRQT